jgi:hypothetical protein
VGTEAFWIPAAIAALGTGANYVNQRNANNREQGVETQNILDQQALQQKGAGQAAQLTQQIAKDNPTAIQGQATGDYVAQLRKNAAGSTQGGGTSPSSSLFGASVSALAPSTVGGSRYNAGTAASQQQVQDYGNNLAGEMGGIDAAVRQRQNEGLSMQDLATSLNTLGAQSNSTNFVNQLRAATAGQQNPWVSLVGNALQAGGSAAAANGAFAGGKTALLKGATGAGSGLTGAGLASGAMYG